MNRIEHPYLAKWNLLVPQRWVPTMLLMFPIVIVLILIYLQQTLPMFQDFGNGFGFLLIGALLVLIGLIVIVTCESLVLTASYVSTDDELEVILFDNVRVMLPWDMLRVERVVELERYSIAGFFFIPAAVCHPCVRPAAAAAPHRNDTPFNGDWF